jgi:trans-aconitate 2-methyltransferase
MSETTTFTTRTDSAASLVEIWRRFRPAPGPARVLDLGCGTGEVAMAIAAENSDSRSVGLDIAQSNIDRAVQSARGAGLSQRTSFVCSPYESWPGDGVFDAILSESVLHLIAMDTDALARRLASDVAPGGLLIATMPVATYGNSLVLALRRLWRMTPARLDRLILVVGKLIYPQFSAAMIEERLPYMRMVPARLCDVEFNAALASAGFDCVAELPWPSPSIAKLKHAALVWRRGNQRRV